MTSTRSPFVLPRAKHSVGERDAIGSPAHERSMMLELASTLEEWPARNIVFRRRLEQVAREIVRLAGTQPGPDSDGRRAP